MTPSETPDTSRGRDDPLADSVLQHIRAQTVASQGSLELARQVRRLGNLMTGLLLLLALFAGLMIYNQLRMEHFLRQTIEYYEQMLGPPEEFGEGGILHPWGRFFDDGCRNPREGSKGL